MSKHCNVLEQRRKFHMEQARIVMDEEDVARNGTSRLRDTITKACNQLRNNEPGNALETLEKSLNDCH